MAGGSHYRAKVGANSWKNIRRRFWRNEAKNPGVVELWGEENVKRMKRGLAPQKWAEVVKFGDENSSAMLLSMELHHVFGIKEVPQDDETIIMLWPHHHSYCDPDRKLNFTFIRWLE